MNTGLLAVAVAHRNRSDPQSPTPSKRRRVTFLLCRIRTL
ncbi:hypothetical protein SM2011_a6316 (plasmid) [Sinorhizobium meliloti 2011]|nr:hypothetical protein SM2011_a6316 [Sinorhizobium meliloti 2011]